LKIIQILYPIYRLGNKDFIKELYRQILHRHPDDQGTYHHLQLLGNGHSKVDVICGILQSPEATHLYEKSLSTGQSPKTVTITTIIHRAYLASDLHFVLMLYNDFLHRLPHTHEQDLYLYYIKKGVTRRQLLTIFMESEECRSLLDSSRLPVNEVIPPGKVIQKVNNVGVFLGFATKVRLDGEGIGRFTFRLVQGLLICRPDLVIKVYTLYENVQEVERVFKRLKAQYAKRLFVCYLSMYEVNQKADVDVWLVPYIGIELAQYLQKPFVVTVHDLVHRHFKEMYGRNSLVWSNWLDRTAEAVASKASAFVFSSNYTRDHEGLKFLGVSSIIAHVIRLAIPVEEYDAMDKGNEAEFRQRYGLFGSYIVFPSVIRLHKNHTRLIEAFLQFKNTSEGRRSGIQLVLTDGLADRPTDKDIKSLLDSCRDSRLRNSILFLNRIPTTDLPQLYRYAIGTIIPTLFEGSVPFPILESLSVNTPVAISRIPVTLEVAPDLSPSFDPYSIHEMREAIGILYRQNKSLLDGQKAAMGGLMQRNWVDVAEDYYKILLEVAQKS
jgi:glycosyltransferase involved in cell wall biosynthesis